MRTSCRGLLAGLLLLPLLTGCFASREDVSSSSGPSGSPAGARLRVALAFAPTEHYSPYGQDAFIMSRLGVSEGLTTLDANGTAIPALAESWSSDKDDRSWVFTLRHATFQDGTAVTAEAVASALNHAARAEPTPTALTGVRLTAEADGEDRVRVGTGTADPVLPLRLSNPSLAVFAPKAYKTNGTVNPVGTATGPFEITKITGDTAATLNRFDGYWDGLAQASGIDVQFIADGTARADALRTGQVDIAQAIPVSQIASLDKDTVHETDTARDTSLYLNTRSGPFTDPGRRAAAREAIGTSVIARQVYEGYAEPAKGLFGPALPWTAGKRVAPTGRAEATPPDGRTVTIATYATRPELPEVAQVLQQDLEKAGFKVKLVVRSDSQVESDMLAGKYDAAVTSRDMMLDTGDPVSVLASDFTCHGTYNLSQLCDSDVDRLVAAAQAQSDTGRRQDAAMKAEAAILGTDAVIPLVHVQAVLGIAASVRGALFSWDERQYVGTGTRR